ncbi:2906_t:CDS:1 [Paraglomus occultum]|uniref:2906_t:CDS:1 n=1 Tax=Paraglomus occultum TaxID=144539 RepID=A0A9N9AI69_9GLOM|nr:2906_t:CDS:1 [Paraglomus occultum]
MKFNLNTLLVLLAFLLATVNAAPAFGTHRGDLTFYQPGLGACGRFNKASDFIAAVSHTLYDQFTIGGNPNNNSLCGRRIKVTFGSKSIFVRMVDRCEGCQPDDLDLSPAAFGKLAPLSRGRIRGSWRFA